MYAFLLAGLALTIIVVAVWKRRVRSRRRTEASLLARDLIPEIRAILDSSSSDGEPAADSRYRAVRDRLPGVLGRESLFAVETFYQCVEAYRDASKAMEEAFEAASERSLGDRIRAKDRRDRSLKDVYFSGQAAIEKLGELS